MLEVYYDGWCPMCTAIALRMERLDWLGQLRFVSFRDGLSPAAQVGLSPAALAERLHVRVSGRVVAGIWAVAAIARRVPLLWPLWPFVVVSGWLGVGGWLYDWIARRRAIVPACGGDGCRR